VSPDGYRSEGTPSLSEGPDARGETFASFGAFAKGSRCKSETISGRYRRNGYVHPERKWSAVRPSSRAGSLPQGNVVHLREIGRLSGRHREQARSHRGMLYICEKLVGCQAVIASRLAPTGECCTSARNWSAFRPPSRAGSLPQGNVVHLREIGRLSGRHREQARSHRGMLYICEKLVGFQAAIAGKPAPTVGWSTPEEQVNF